MGSPVSAVIANLYMDDFEEQAGCHPYLARVRSGSDIWMAPSRS